MKLSDEGYWNVDGEGELVVAVTKLPSMVWARARYPLAFLPPVRKPIDIDMSHNSAFGMRYPVIIDYEPPTFLLLRDRWHYEPVLEQLHSLNLKWFGEVDHDLIGGRWSPPDDTQSYIVHGAISMDDTALMAFRMAISD